LPQKSQASAIYNTPKLEFAVILNAYAIRVCSAPKAV